MRKTFSRALAAAACTFPLICGATIGPPVANEYYEWIQDFDSVYDTLVVNPTWGDIYEGQGQLDAMGHLGPGDASDHLRINFAPNASIGGQIITNFRMYTDGPFQAMLSRASTPTIPLALIYGNTPQAVLIGYGDYVLTVQTSAVPGVETQYGVEFGVTLIPEPATWMMFGTALALLAAWRRFARPRDALLTGPA